MSLCCEVVEVGVYETIVDTSSKDILREKLEKKEVDYITFTSTSTVKHFLGLIGEDYKDLLKDVKIVSIGDITSKALKDVGLWVDMQPDVFTIDAMITCILKKKGEEQ